MKCPFCADSDSKVTNSRLSRNGLEIRRRRECISCVNRFTTYERIEEVPVMIVKKDGRREVFNRDKVRSGLQKACEKRNVSMTVIDEFVNNLERDLKENGENEFSSKEVGEKVMDKLHDLDDIAYVRFASIYREFKDVNDFMAELKVMFQQSKLNKVKIEQDQN